MKKPSGVKKTVGHEKAVGRADGFFALFVGYSSDSIADCWSVSIAQPSIFALCKAPIVF